ncbi:MAG TPA: hypothetical protein VFP58_15555 [Candidatus Eisenbacteria bacterium]|nr:hypothetical protein [Candidatus Eisenbacteria bacterium]
MRRLHPKPTRCLLALALLFLMPSRPNAQDAPSKGLPVGDDAPVVLRTPATQADRDRVRARLASAERALPKPSSTFRLAPEGEERRVGADAGKLDAPDGWNPIPAWLSRSYETRTASEDERTLEINLALNGERGLSTGLATVGGAVQILDRKGALFVRQSILGAEEGSRVAVPLSPEDSKRALTLVRAYVVPPDLESGLRKRVQQTEDLPRLGDGDVTSSRPDGIAAIIVEIRGERRDVDALAPRIDIAALRKLVAP